MIRTTHLLGAALILTVSVACGSQPIPLSAVEGTTVTLFIPGNFPTIGYGRRLVQFEDQENSVQPYLDSPLEDPQRGELAFGLYQGQTFRGWLPLRYITRIEMSSASPSAAELDSDFFEQGQTIALVDIPVGDEVVPVTGDYEIKVLRKRRVLGSPNEYEYLTDTQYTSSPPQQYWTGWGKYDAPPIVSGQPTPTDAIPIHIVDSPEENFIPTPLHGWAHLQGIGVTWGDATSDLNSLVPYPEFAVEVVEAGQPPPAAWEMELSYPRKKLRIRSVSLMHPARSRAFLHWEAEDPDAIVDCNAAEETGILEIQMIDPERVAKGVRVAYQLRNFGDSACAGRASAGDFAVIADSFRAYDEDGEELSGATHSIPASSFR